MGEAKRRGTFEQRQAKAIEVNEKLLELKRELRKAEIEQRAQERRALLLEQEERLEKREREIDSLIAGEKARRLENGLPEMTKHEEEQYRKSFQAPAPSRSLRSRTSSVALTIAAVALATLAAR